MTPDNVISFDKARNRRYTRPSGKQESGLVSFRGSTTDLRKIDEIVASRVDPELKTRSDVINDALHTWVQVFLDEFGDEFPRMVDTLRLEHINHLAESREKDFEIIRDALNLAVKEGNEKLLSPISFNAIRLKNEVTADPYGSPRLRKDLEAMIEKIQKEMGHG